LLRKGTGGGRLWKRECNFGFYKVLGISCLPEVLLASQEAVCSMEFAACVLFGGTVSNSSYAALNDQVIVNYKGS
jgi:hypothetical protein